MKVEEYLRKRGGRREKRKKRHIASIVMVAIVALAAFSIIPVSAPGNPGAGCPSETKFYDTIHGGIYFEQQGWAQYKSMTKTFNSVPEGIKIARVYTGFWQGSPAKGGKFNITIANAAGSYTTLTYQACDPCPGAPCASYQSDRCDALNWSGNVPPDAPSGDIHDYIVGCGVQFISFNATPYITPGSNTITVRNSCDSCTCWDSRIYLIALLVVYENSSMPEMTYWINEGAAYMEKGSFCDGPEDHLDASFYFNGTHLDNPENVTYSILGWPHVLNACEAPAYTKLNGNNIGYPDITESHAGGYNEVFVRYDNLPIGYLDPSSNFLEYYDPDPLYERAFAAWLVVQGPNGKPDLTVTDINVCWPDNCTICYNVTNIGTEVAPACHHTTLYVDGVAVAHDHVPVDLEHGESYLGCFDGYTWQFTPPSDNITVCADNDETLDELDEDNNCLTNIWMCGDVNGDGKVTMSDVRKVFNRYLDPNYPLDLPWAADVNCDGKVTMSDVRKVFNRYLDSNYDLNCCCGGVE